MKCAASEPGMPANVAIKRSRGYLLEPSEQRAGRFGGGSSPTPARGRGKLRSLRKQIPLTELPQQVNRHPRRSVPLVLIIGVLLFFSAHASAEERTFIADIDITTHTSKETIQLITSAKLTSRSYILTDPWRLVVDIPRAELVPGFLQKVHESPWIKGVRASQFLLTPPTVRVVVDLKGKFPYEVREEKDTLSITLLPPGSPAKEPGIGEQLQSILGRAHETISDLEAGRWPSEVFWETSTKSYEALPSALFQKVLIPRIALWGKQLTVERMRTDRTDLPYFSLQDIAEKLGGTLEFREESGSATLQLENGTQIALRVGEKHVIVNGKSEPLPQPPVVVRTAKESKMLVPSFRFFESFGLSSHEATSGDIALLPSIDNVSLEHGKGFERIILRTSGPFENFPAEFRDARETAEVTLPYVTFNKTHGVYAIEDRGISRIKLFSTKKTHSKVQLSFNLPKAFLLTSNASNNEVILTLAPSITTIKPTRAKNQLKILAQTNGGPAPSVQLLEKPLRLIVDFPGHIIDPKTLPSVASNFPTGIELRGGQQQLSPPLVQLVFDLQTPTKYFWKTTRAGKELQLTFVQGPKISVAEMRASQFSKWLRGRVIAIEAGHGGDDPGSKALNGTWEKDLTLRTALALAEKLSRAGAHILLSRERDISVPLSQVVNMVNSNRVDLFLSVHYNAYIDPKIRGTETYYFTSRSRRLAERLHKKISASLRLPDRGVRRMMFYTVHHSRVPSVLIEPLYITNPEEAALLNRPNFHKNLAWDIVQALKGYFRLKG